MGIQVLGISGSPVPNSNTDRAVKRILELTGLSSQFVKLSELESLAMPGVPGMREDEPVRCGG